MQDEFIYFIAITVYEKENSLKPAIYEINRGLTIGLLFFNELFLSTTVLPEKFISHYTLLRNLPLHSLLIIFLHRQSVKGFLK